MDTREREMKAPAGAGNGTGEPPYEAGPERRNMRPVMYVVGAIVLIAAIIFGAKYFAYARSHESTDDATVDANAVEVTSKINERIDKILVDTNQPVKKGQLLIVLDDATEKAAVAQAKANLQYALENQSAGVTQGSGGVAQAQAQASTAQAQVAEAQSGVAAAQAQVQQAQADLPAARQALDQAQANLNRTQALVKTGDMPRANLDTAKAQYAQASSQYQAAQQAVDVARANLNAAQQKVGAAQSGVAAAQGSVQAAQGKLNQAQAPAQIAAERAALTIAEQNLANTKISAAINGYVGEKSVEVGQTVNAGMALLTLIPDQVFVTANFKETQVGNMRAGQPVDIKVDAYKGVTFHGTVASINPASQSTYALVPAQNATGNFVKVTQRIPVRIAFDKDTDFSKYPMRPGMSVEAAVKVH